MAEHLNLDILTPDGRIDLRATKPSKSSSKTAEPIEVEGVELPAALGEMGVRPRHIPFLTPVKPGVVRFRYGGADQRMAVGAGFLEIAEDGTVTILTERALRSSEIVVDEVRKQHAEVLAELKEHAQSSIEDATVLKLLARRDWLEAQLRAAAAI